MPLCGVCPSFPPSIWVSVTLMYSVKISKHFSQTLSPLGRRTILVFHTKPYGNIVTRTIITGALNAGVLGKISIFGQYLAID